MPPRGSTLGGKTVGSKEYDEAAKKGTKPKTTKVVRKKKAAPLPVPSLTIQYTPTPTAPKKPGRRVASSDPVPKPEPHGGHKPQRYMFTPIEDLLLPPEPESIRARQIKRWNQTKERARRADLKQERLDRAARRAEVRKIPKDAREMIGREALQDYIKHGPQEDNPGFGDMARGLLKATPGLVKKGALGSVEYIDRVVTDWRTELSGGLSGRRAGMRSEIQPEDNDLVMAAGEGLVGHDLMKAVRGEDFDPRMALVEAALLGIPIKGLPTSVSAMLRVTLGVGRYAKLVRANASVATAIKSIPKAEWTKPVLKSRAERRAALRKGDNIASSKVAGLLAGKGHGPIRDFIRNDPRAQRTFKIEGDGRTLEVQTPADLSRTGKLVRGQIDKHRDRLGIIPGITSQQKMVDKVLVQHAEGLMNQYAGVQSALRLPRNKLGQVDWPGVYAVRAVLKNHNLGEVINRTAKDMAAAEAAGDALGARALMHHLNYFKAAMRYVEPGPNGESVLRADAPEGLRKLQKSVSDAVDSREKILGDFDLLTESRARDRILNEEKFYQGATHQVKNDYIQAALEASPIRAQALALLAEHHPASKKTAIALLDAQARTYYEGLVKESKEKLEDLRHLMLEDPSDEVTMNARYMNARRLQQEIENLSPATFYEHFSGVQDELPYEIVAELTEEYGAQGVDWFFRMHDLMGDGDDAAKRIAEDIMSRMDAEGLKLPPELDTPEKLQQGIQNVFALAREGEAGKDWYPGAAQGVMLVSEHTGVPPKQVAQLFAIFSQAADTVANSTFVFDAIRQWQTHGDLFSGRFPVRQSEEALKVLRGEGYEGRKRNSFYANILRHIPGMEDEYAATIKEMAEERGAEIKHPVTVDRWVVRMFSESLGDVPGSYYDTFETIMQEMAAARGWEPEQIQAAAWVAMKDRGLQAETARGGRKTVRHIAGAEDDFRYGIRRQIEKEEAGLFDTEKYAITPEQKRQKNRAQKLVKAVNKEWGGFTVDKNLNPVPEEGYVVTLSLTETEFPLHGVTLADLDHFRERYADLLKDKRHVLGGFSDDANEAGDGTMVTYLSISRQFKRKADAMKFAREQGQETVYEYPKVDPKTGKKPKIGDGIRTGLDRDEQAAIIQGLRDAEAIPREKMAPPPLPDAEREYQRFLAKAAVEMNITKPGKVATASQKARAEEWLLRHGGEYPDEPLMKEFDRVYDQRPAMEEPEWMRFRLAARAQTQAGPAPVNPAGIADALIGVKGEALAKTIPGYATAVKQLDAADIPTNFIKRVWTSKKLHEYEKVQIGLHLNRLSGGGLRNRAFPDIPGAERMFDEQKMGGLYMGDRRLVVQSPTGRGIDMLHEFFHGAEGQHLLPPGLRDDMLVFVGAAPGTAPRDLTTQQAEDMADMWEAMFLGFDASKSKLPKSVQKKMKKFSDSMKGGAQGPTKRAQAMLDKLPEEIRLNIEDALWFDAKAGKRSGMYGAGPDFQHRPGGRYVPEQQGLPFSFSERMLGPRRYGTLYNRLKEGRRVQTLTPTDQALEHAFTGRLLASGRWARDVTSGPMHGLIKAMEIEKMAYLRDNLLDATTDIPRHVTDIAIPVDPKAFAESRGANQELADLFALFDVMDSALPVHAQELDRVTISGIEQAREYFFPGLVDNAGPLGKAQIQQLAANTVKPIDGVRWISRQHLDRTGIISPPGLNARIKGTWAKGTMSALDDANNILKLLTLSLNPSYYTMNLAGQGVMLLMQQGPLAPVSLARSLVGMRGMSEEGRAILAAHAGIGQASVLAPQGGFAKGMVDVTQRFANEVIDKHPRMAAIVGEARRLGYKTGKELDDLVLNPANADDLFTAGRRANRAMVDFQNLSYNEREYIGRLIFVYPWLRASAKWGAQFPFDHPIQAAAFAGLLYWQQQRLKESFPEGHPGYLKWYFPIEGGEDPYGFRLDQMFTPLQPIDLAGELAWLITGGEVPWGANEDALVSRLNPLVEEIFTAIVGYDAFRQEEVQRNLLGFFRRMVDPEQRYASWSRIQKVLKNETHKGLYDTNQTQNWLRVLFGSLAPVDVNTEVAAQMEAPTKTIRVADVAPEEKEREFLQDVRERAEKEGVEVPADLEKWHRASQEYTRQESKFLRDHDLDSLHPQEALAVLVLTWGVIEGREDEAAARVKTALAMSEEDAEAALEEGREKLGISRIERIKGRLSDANKSERPVVTP
jgi:hypothetical protein